MVNSCQRVGLVIPVTPGLIRTLLEGTRNILQGVVRTRDGQSTVTVRVNTFVYTGVYNRSQGVPYLTGTDSWCHDVQKPFIFSYTPNRFTNHVAPTGHLRSREKNARQ